MKPGANHVFIRPEYEDDFEAASGKLTLNRKSALNFRFVGHHERDATAADDFSVRDVIAFDFFAVHQNLLHVNVFVALILRFDG